MTAKELSDFCETREVQVSMRYSRDYDTIIVAMRKKTQEANIAVARDVATAKRFDLLVKVALQQMADKLEEAEKGNKAAAVPSRL